MEVPVCRHACGVSVSWPIAVKKSRWHLILRIDRLWPPIGYRCRPPWGEIVLKQYIWKKKKLLRGLFATLKGSGSPYEANSWWDSSFYTSGVSDRQTISPNKSLLSSLYHYSSVEMLILRHLFNENVRTDGVAVLDIGSGSGHWIEFWKKLGAASLTGLDVSETSVGHLRSKYSGSDGISIHHGKAVDVLPKLSQSFQIVNAIGVMFHIVDDDEWSRTVSMVSDHLDPGGLFVVGGDFGWLNKINVQFDEHRHVNKRIRSKRGWIKQLRASHFETYRVYRNQAYLHIDDTLPENNLLIAQKCS